MICKFTVVWCCSKETIPCLSSGLVWSSGESGLSLCFYRWRALLHDVVLIIRKWLEKSGKDCFCEMWASLAAKVNQCAKLYRITHPCSIGYPLVMLLLYQLSCFPLPVTEARRTPCLLFTHSQCACERENSYAVSVLPSCLVKWNSL